MDGEVLAARAHPAVVASAVVAAVAVTACALVAIAWMLGWVPSRPRLPLPVSVETPAKPAPTIAHDAALLPGETLVTSPEPPKSAIPQAAAPPPAAKASSTQRPVDAVRPVAPSYGRAPDASAPKPAGPALPSYAQTLPSRAAPAAQSRPPPPVTSYERATRGICINCGSVTSITSYDSDEWDVRVRFEDGSSETLHYRTRPQLRIGQRVHLEEGRLIAE